MVAAIERVPRAPLRVAGAGEGDGASDAVAAPVKEEKAEGLEVAEALAK